MERMLRLSCDVACGLLAAIALGPLLPSPGTAQTTLVLRTDGEASGSLDAQIDEVLRDRLGGSVRRVDPSMDDLALAAGCRTSSTDPECVAAIGAGAGVRLVALQRLAREGDGWRVTVDLRRPDGTRIRELTGHCIELRDCGAALDAELGADPTALAADASVAAPTASAAPSVVAVEPRVLLVEPSPSSRGRGVAAPEATPVALVADVAPRAWRAPPITSSVLFVGAGVLGVGAAIGGGLGVSFASDAAALGVVRTERGVDRVRALEDQSAVALGVGIALAFAGAALATAGAITLGVHTSSAARVRLTPSLAGLSLSVSL